MTEGGKFYREMIEKKMMYVHEVQHWLRKKDNVIDGLKVSEFKN